MLDYDIKKMYEDMEIRLIRSMRRNLKRHLNEEDETGFDFPQWQAMKIKELKRYQRQNKEIVGESTKGYTKLVSSYLKNELKQGSYRALKQYREAMGDKYKANKRLSNSFFKINDKKVNALINVVNNDLKTADKAVLRMSNDQYRKVVHKSAMFLANGTMTPSQAIDMANEEFLRRGLNVIEYKDGRRVNIASYSQMAIRTAGQRATLMGEGEFRKKYKQPLVRVTTHGTSCPLCKEWQGKILIDDVYGGGTKKDGNYTLLSTAMKQGFLHPNCRHGLTTYFADIEDINESYRDGKDGSESDAQYQEDINYINRKIKEYRRLKEGSVLELNIQRFGEKESDWKKELSKKKQVDAVHSTTEKNAISILKNGFNQNMFKKGVFGKGIYASKDKDIIDYYRIDTTKDNIVNLTFDTTDYISFNLEGIQETEAMMYNNLIDQVSYKMKEEYTELLKKYRRRKYKNRDAFLEVVQKEYKGMILEHDLSMITEEEYEKYKLKIDKINKTYIDYTSGGSQIVAWDTKTVKIRRNKK